METERGDIVEEEKEIKDLRKNYFEKLLNLEGVQEQDEELAQIVEVEEISWNEVEIVLKSIKNIESAGPDELMVDMIKALGVQLGYIG